LYNLSCADTVFVSFSAHQSVTLSIKLVLSVFVFFANALAFLLGVKKSTAFQAPTQALYAPSYMSCLILSLFACIF
jgi:hypothetical protein